MIVDSNQAHSPRTIVGRLTADSSAREPCKYKTTDSRTRKHAVASNCVQPSSLALVIRFQYTIRKHLI